MVNEINTVFETIVIVGFTEARELMHKIKTKLEEGCLLRYQFKYNCCNSLH